MKADKTPNMLATIEAERRGPGRPKEFEDAKQITLNVDREFRGRIEGLRRKWTRGSRMPSVSSVAREALEIGLLQLEQEPGAGPTG